MTGYVPDRRDLREAAAASSRRDAILARAARYSRWDGTPAVPDLDADEMLDALADDLMAEGDLAAALRRLHGARLAARRPDAARHGRPPGPDASGSQRRARGAARPVPAGRRRWPTSAQELDEIVAEERAGVERGSTGRRRRRTAGVGRARRPQLRRMLRDMAARRLDQLDALPRRRRRADPRAAGLRLPRARRARALRRAGRPAPRARCSTSTFAGLSDAIRGITPEELAANREMVRDLNQLLQERLAGGDPDASRLPRASTASFFPGARTLDDIIEQLAQRMAAMQSLLRVDDAGAAAELQDMMDALLRDDRLRWDLAQLAATLDQLLPGGLGERFRFRRRRAARPRGRARSSSAGSRRSTRWRTQLGDIEAPRRPRRRSTATSCASSSATTPAATSPRSTTWPDSWRRPATSSATATGSS